MEVFFLLQNNSCLLAVQVERLEEVRDQERESPIFTELPANHIFEVANLVLDNATQVSHCCCMYVFLILFRTLRRLMR